MNITCEVLVVGGGPGGYSAAIRAGQLGRKTVIVEKERFGGTCLNVGCIPTKAMVHCANLYEELTKAAGYGVKAHVEPLDFPAFQKKKQAHVDRLVGGVEFLLKNAKVETCRGKAVFLDSHRVSVKRAQGEETVIFAQHIILAMGSRPRRIPGLEFNGTTILSSTDGLALDHLPRRLGVMGAGVVGMEFASIFSRLGSKVTVFEMMDRILPAEDAGAVEFLQKSMSKQGVTFYVSAGIEGVVQKKDGLELKVKTPAGTTAVTVDKLIVAAGRTTNVDGIGLEKTGVTVENGRVPVDCHMRTNIPHIYAVGDIVPSLQLAHVAYEEGAVAAETIAGLERSVSYGAVPRCTYTAPEVCGVGLTEEQARQAHPNAKSYRVSFGAVGKAVIEGKDEGFVKLIVDPTYGEILGCVIVGQGISDLISIPAAAMSLEGTLEALADVVIAHPSLSEAVKEVALLAAQRPLHVK